MQKKRKRRSVQERIADNESELLELRERKRREDFKAALKDGRVASGSRAEFSSSLQELRLIHQAIKAAERHEQSHLVEPLQVFKDKIAESMANLVNGGGPSTV